jgi:hypothetical protein
LIKNDINEKTEIPKVNLKEGARTIAEKINNSVQKPKAKIVLSPIKSKIASLFTLDTNKENSNDDSSIKSSNPKPVYTYLSRRKSLGDLNKTPLLKSKTDILQRAKIEIIQMLVYDFYLLFLLLYVLCFFFLKWSDPREKIGTFPSPRLLGCLFGPDVTEVFLLYIFMFL